MTDESESATEANAIQTHGNRVRKIYQFGAILIAVALVSSGLTLVAIGDGPSGFPTILMPGSLVEDASYVVFVDNGVYYAKDGREGQIQSDSSFDDLIEDLMIDVSSTGGGIIHLKKGDYPYSEIIEPLSGVTIRGEGEQTVLYDAGYLVYRINIVDAPNVTLRDFKLKISHTDPNPGTGIRVIRSDHFEMSNIILEGTVFTITPWLAVPRWGVAVSDSILPRILECRVYHSDYEALSFFDNVTGGIMDSNYVSNCGFGLVAERNGTHGCVLSNNVIYQMRRSGSFDILLRNVIGCTVIGNTIIGANDMSIASYGIQLDKNVRNCVVSSNTIDLVHSGISVKTYSHENIIIGNSITRTIGGIFIDATSKMNSISHNKITFSGGIGIFSSDNVVANNEIAYCGGSGSDASILLSGDVARNIVTDNKIRTPFAYGILVQSFSPNSAQDITIRDNFVYDDADRATGNIIANVGVGATFLKLTTRGIFEAGMFIQIGTDTVRILNVTTYSDYDTPAYLEITPAIASGYSSGEPIAGVQKMTYGIRNSGNASFSGTMIADNRVANASSANIYYPGAGVTFESNIGYRTENYGTAVMLTGTKTIVATHGLIITPSIVFAIGNDTEVSDLWITGIGGLYFTINAPTNLALNRTIYWYAEV